MNYGSAELNALAEQNHKQLVKEYYSIQFKIVCIDDNHRVVPFDDRQNAFTQLREMRSRLHAVETAKAERVAAAEGAAFEREMSVMLLKVTAAIVAFIAVCFAIPIIF